MQKNPPLHFFTNPSEIPKISDWMAGAGGIEPPNGGIKIPCLTAWLRPNGPERAKSDLADLLRAPTVYRENPVFSTGWSVRDKV